VRISHAQATKEVEHKSPHVDARKFAGGFIPPGAGTTAVEVYYERFDIRKDAARLNAIQEDDLVRNCPDLGVLRGVVTAYSQMPYKPGNLRLMLDWYRDGVPVHAGSAPGNGTGPPRNGPVSFAQQSMDAGERYRERKRRMENDGHNEPVTDAFRLLSQNVGH
jgi:hypothetical protein